MTDVALVMGFLKFVFVLCCRLLCREKNIGCFPYFLLSHSSSFINHRYVTQSKKIIQQCIFFTDIYLLVICMFFLKGGVFFCCFYCVLLFLWGANRTQVRGVVSHWHFTIIYKKQNIVFNHHTNVQSIK